MKVDVVWNDVNCKLPEHGDSVLTIGKKESGEWATLVFATYHDGKFLTGYSFEGDRVIRTVVETKPTHWAYFDSTPEGVK